MDFEGKIFVSLKSCFIISLLQAHRAGAIILPDSIFDSLQNSLFICNSQPPSYNHLDFDLLFSLYDNFFNYNS